MADATPQQHAEALEVALSGSAEIIKHAWHWHADPVKGDPLGRSRYEVITIGRTITRTYYTDAAALQEAALICAAVNAARSLLDERKRLREALELIRDTDPIDAALDPQRAVRAAQEALK